MDLLSDIFIRKRRKVYTASGVHQQELVTRPPALVKTNDVIITIYKNAKIEQKGECKNISHKVNTVDKE